MSAPPMHACYANYKPSRRLAPPLSLRGKRRMYNDAALEAASSLDNQSYTAEEES